MASFLSFYFATFSGKVFLIQQDGYANVGYNYTDDKV